MYLPFSISLSVWKSQKGTHESNHREMISKERWTHHSVSPFQNLSCKDKSESRVSGGTKNNLVGEGDSPLGSKNRDGNSNTKSRHGHWCRATSQPTHAGCFLCLYVCQSKEYKAILWFWSHVLACSWSKTHCHEFIGILNYRFRYFFASFALFSIIF